MLIDFSPDGKVQFTRHPQLLELFPDDPKRVTRMTDIKFDSRTQRYFIKFLTGAYKGQHLSRKLDCYEEFKYGYGGLLRDLGVKYIYNQAFCSFSTYEDAVKIEIEFIDFLREQGIPVQ